VEQQVTDGRQPPVNEVSLSVALAPQDLLIGPRLPEILGSAFSRYSKIEVVPVYNMPVEYPSPQESFPRSGIPRLEFVPAGGVEPRYWLVSDDDVYVVQVQRDYLAFNWRRREPGQEYVRYSTIRANFSEVSSTIQENLTAKGGQLLPQRAELTYVNVIAPNAVWRSLSDIHRLIAIRFAESSSYEQLAFSYSKALYEQDGPWIGRLHVALNPVYDWMKDEPRLTLNITARSGNFSKPSIGAALNFLDVAHNYINSTFLDLLTAEAREMWGLDEDE
jgi:uncharacterized protein (TIGR04255 family)